ncbi:MAG: putative ribosomal RNA large subunit methyltransferase J [Streblomastix strix]|uniref:Putative tRNA (cytidine(32)/guanosine(34)-2'-O)-methyltransferase n=1 Tax=Streblomastix strix TaxID=222440 RepID=A0A5J4WRG9_9EUKA|nr:MAG: putative ribosomal RNA large subunit methyltransferase J [Streblomastix strix]
MWMFLLLHEYVLMASVVLKMNQIIAIDLLLISIGLRKSNNMGRASKDKRDIFYRKSKQEGFRARSAFKLIQIDEQFGLFASGVKNVVDLCAAPGSWSQVCAQRLQNIPNFHIVAIDLNEMIPIPGVIMLKGDITSQKSFEDIISSCEGNPIDLVLSDGAPDVTGLHEMDEYLQGQLLLSALQLAVKLLRPQGKFVAKIFRGRDVSLLYNQMHVYFSVVHVAKPQSSRNSSIESFVVCEDFKNPIEHPLIINILLHNDDKQENKTKDDEKQNSSQSQSTITQPISISSQQSSSQQQQIPSQQQQIPSQQSITSTKPKPPLPLRPAPPPPIINQSRIIPSIPKVSAPPSRITQEQPSSTSSSQLQSDQSQSSSHLQMSQFLNSQPIPFTQFSQIKFNLENCLVPFVACGDLNGFDSDSSYPVDFLNGWNEPLLPLAPPINPPYKDALLKR